MFHFYYCLYILIKITIISYFLFVLLCFLCFFLSAHIFRLKYSSFVWWFRFLCDNFVFSSFIVEISTMTKMTAWTELSSILSRIFMTRGWSVMKLWSLTSSASSGSGTVIRSLMSYAWKNYGNSGPFWVQRESWCPLELLWGWVHGWYQ